MIETIVKANLSEALGQSFIDDLFLGKSRYYISIGRSYPWNTVDDSPELVIDTEKYQRQAMEDSLLFKKIDETNISFLIPRIDYEFGKIYDIYDDTISMDGKQFYVMTSEFNVYKCLWNNNGQPSTLVPTGISNRQITYSDGYVWKFIYTIPTSIRNKFLSPIYIPVYNALTQKYYSRGSINSIQIQSAGDGYTQGATDIIVSGDGFLEFNPRRIVDFNIFNSGSGYTTIPDVEVEDNVTNPRTFASGLTVSVGQNLKVVDSSGTRFYRVESSGVTTSVAPTHYYSIASNGTATLRHIVTKPSLTATIDATAIGTVTILEGGFGYQETPTITTDGTGTGATFSVLESGSVQVVTVLTNGTGYSTGVLSISEPYDNAEVFAVTTFYPRDTILKVIISGDTYYYLVTTEGTTDLVEPVHITGSAMNGTAVLLVVAKRARVEGILGIVTSVTGGGDVEYVKVTDGGSGYTQGTVSVSVTGGSPIEPAVLNAVVVDGSVTEIIVSYAGSGYTSAPTVVIADSGTGSGADATAFVQLGYGYDKNPLLVFSTPDNVGGTFAEASGTTIKSEAILSPVVIDGKVRGVKIIDGGVGYTEANLLVNGDGVEASVAPIFGVGDLTTIQAQTELTAIKGTVSSVVITDGGAGISSANVSIVGDGTGALAKAVLSNGIIKEIKILSAGQNYTFATAVISVNTNKVRQPTARVILSPLNGHASNPIKELYTKTIGLFGIFSEETNNGFVLDNGFRQVSIYKNPLKFKSTFALSEKNASSCYACTANLLEIPLEKNIIMTIGTTSKKFRLIDFSESSILLQPIGRSEINAKDSLNFVINNITYSIIVSTVAPPSVDKYSGELLFIDNFKEFVPTDAASVSINTSIQLN